MDGPAGPGEPSAPGLSDGAGTPHPDAGLPTLTVTEQSHGRGLVSWDVPVGSADPEGALRALRLAVQHGVTTLGLHRLEVLIDPDDDQSIRIATRAGFRREGLLRGHAAGADRVLLARLASDPPTGDARGFRSMLNSFLPRKRAIGQMLVRDREGRVLLCGLTYKDDWDLPGGVVEVNESPREAVSRELEEELGLRIDAGPLLLTDWLPPWSGWDDALCLVFDGGVHDAGLLDGAVLEAREIRSVAFCTPQQIRERAADFTARRVESALASLGAPGGPSYTESGRF